MEPFRHCKYSIAGQRLNIEPSCTEEFVGRFDSSCKQKIDSLIKGQLYLAGIEQLNDAFEGRSLIGCLDAGSPDDTSKFFNRGLAGCAIGSISFTKSCLNPSMWGLYTNNEGFYVRYKTDQLLNSLSHPDSHVLISNPFDISYPNEGEFGKVYEELRNRIMDMSGIFAPLQFKCDIWHYESEVRIIGFANDVNNERLFETKKSHFLPNLGGKTSRLLNYNLKSIESITLGLKFLNPIMLSENKDETTLAIKSKSESGNELDYQPKIDLLNFIIDKNIPLRSIMTSTQGIATHEVIPTKNTDSSLIYLEVQMKNIIEQKNL